MSCSEDKESFISLKMNVLQNHLWLSQNENCEYCFYDTKIFLQNWNLGLCVMIFSLDSGKQQRICLKIVYIFTSLTSQLMPLTVPKTVRGFLHGAVFTRGFQFLTDWPKHYYPLCLVPSNCSSFSKRDFLFWNQTNIDKDGHGIATEEFMYIK